MQRKYRSTAQNGTVELRMIQIDLLQLAAPLARALVCWCLRHQRTGLMASCARWKTERSHFDSGIDKLGWRRGRRKPVMNRLVWTNSKRRLAFVFKTPSPVTLPGPDNSSRTVQKFNQPNDRDEEPDALH